MANKHRSIRRNVALGALATAAAAGAAAAGYYFYASPDAAKHRRKAAKWARDLQKDVVVRAKKLKDIDRAQLAAIVDEAASAYRTAKDINPTELKRAARELKDNWQLIAADLAGTARAAPKKRSRSSKKKSSKKTSPRS